MQIDVEERSRDAERPPRLLRHVVEVELEVALQSVFSARQDVSELTGTSADRAIARRAMSTLESVTASVRILLALLRAFGPTEQGDRGLFDRGSSAFAVVRRDGHVLYMNAAVSQHVLRDHHTVAGTPFAQRTWSDRAQMRDHLDTAYDDGVADDVFDVVRGDGRRITMRLHTERLDTDGDAVLLMTHVPDRHPAGDDVR